MKTDVNVTVVSSVISIRIQLFGILKATEEKVRGRIPPDSYQNTDPEHCFLVLPLFLISSFSIFFYEVEKSVVNNEKISRILGSNSRSSTTIEKNLANTGYRVDPEFCFFVNCDCLGKAKEI